VVGSICFGSGTIAWVMIDFSFMTHNLENVEVSDLVRVHYLNGNLQEHHTSDDHYMVLAIEKLTIAHVSGLPVSFDEVTLLHLATNSKVHFILYTGWSLERIHPKEP
jgi:hypothetical protein